MIKGVIAAVPTPVDQNFTPLRDAFAEHVRWALDNGCDGLNILGTTGEATSFGRDARLQVMRWATEAGDVNRLMVGTGTPALSETIALTEAADDLGYPVALVLPPYYFKPGNHAGLVDWYMALDRALGSRRIQVWFYNFPQMTGITLSPELVAELHDARPGRFGGIKDSSGDLDYCRALVAAMPGLKVFPSAETALGTADSDRFAGCISATVNQTAPLVQKLWQGRGAAPQPTETVGRIRGAIAGAGLIPAIKHLIGRRTGRPEWDNVVPPLVALDQATKSGLDALAAELAAIHADTAAAPVAG
ncbi:dihydrodipicolinate synthase family protein [Paracoccus pacificus]|uniref:Dihydrodipicolinate synthase family protein n=1 Tax=Paracoccus pacificus TaxID=1463598 RepID=A0ABW4R5W1_9RHOB